MKMDVKTTGVVSRPLVESNFISPYGGRETGPIRRILHLVRKNFELLSAENDRYANLILRYCSDTGFGDASWDDEALLLVCLIIQLCDVYNFHRFISYRKSLVDLLCVHTTTPRFWRYVAGSSHGVCSSWELDKLSTPALDWLKSLYMIESVPGFRPSERFVTATEWSIVSVPPWTIPFLSNNIPLLYTEWSLVLRPTQALSSPHYYLPKALTVWQNVKDPSMRDTIRTELQQQLTFTHLHEFDDFALTNVLFQEYDIFRAMGDRMVPSTMSVVSGLPQVNDDSDADNEIAAPTDKPEDAVDQSSRTRTLFYDEFESLAEYHSSLTDNLSDAHAQVVVQWFMSLSSGCYWKMAHHTDTDRLLSVRGSSHYSRQNNRLLWKGGAFATRSFILSLQFALVTLSRHTRLLLDRHIGVDLPFLVLAYAPMCGNVADVLTMNHLIVGTRAQFYHSLTAQLALLSELTI